MQIFQKQERVARRHGRGDRDPQAVRERLRRARGARAATTATASSRTSRSCTIEGDYTAFAHLETPMLGTLARRTLITTNVVHVLEAANGKPIIFMPARHDHHRVQTGDGYAAYVAGQVVGAEIGVTTDEQASWWGGTRHRHRSARADRVVRRRHGARGEEVRRLGAAGHERHRARRLRERLGPHGARGRRRARRPALGRAARHVGVARRPLALGASWATSSRPG